MFLHPAAIERALLLGLPKPITGPIGQATLKDEDYVINLDQEKDPAQMGHIVATKDLTDERWQDVPHGCLLVFRDGKLVFSSLHDRVKQ